MYGIDLTDHDKKLYEEELAEFLPDKIIDVHIHIWLDGMLRQNEEEKGVVSWPMLVAPHCSAEDLFHSYAQMFPEKTVKPVLMTSPLARLDEGNAYAAACAKKYGLPAYYCIRHDTPLDDIRKAIAEDGFCGVKPYQNHSPAYIPANEIRIYDFITPEQLALMDELGAFVMLHISRPGRLRDPVNLGQMLEIDERYPNAKIIIAHIGRAYSPEDLGNAFDLLKDTKHLLFDFSANTQDKAMSACISAMGPERVLFGSDMPITKMRMYRVSENGRYINVVPRGLYGDVSGDLNMRETDEENISIFMYEELLAFKRCAQELALARSDVEKIFYTNALRLFGLNF